MDVGTVVAMIGIAGFSGIVGYKLGATKGDFAVWNFHLDRVFVALDRAETMIEELQKVAEDSQQKSASEATEGPDGGSR